MSEAATQLELVTAALADRYRLQGPLGHGGMATVYLAHDLKHNREVALKVLKPELAEALGAQRFLKEIQLTAQLQHAHTFFSRTVRRCSRTSACVDFGAMSRGSPTIETAWRSQ